MSLSIKSISYVHPDNEQLFNELNFSIGAGDKSALVGINGAGKSTLLKLLAGDLLPAAGKILASEKPWYVPQHLGQFDSYSIAAILKVDKKLEALHAILDGDADPEYFSDLDDDWEIELKVERALEKWGLGNFGPEQLLGNLSGGQKTKVFLAAMELNSPDIILLDEPSNHLDLSARNKLYDLILQSKATILVVSHDRALLELMNRTLELSKSGIEVFGGNFEFYQQQKKQKVDALQSQLNEQSKTLKETEKKAKEIAYQRQMQEARGKTAGKSNSLPRIIAGGLKSKSQRSTAKIMDTQNEKMSDLAETIRETKSQIQQYHLLKIDIQSSAMPSGKILIEASAINFSYDKKYLWKGLTFQVKSGDRIQIQGDNGVGKSTLLKIITKVLKPQVGLYSSAEFSYLYLDQDYTMINPALSIYEQVQNFNYRGLEEHEIKASLVYSQFDRDSFNKKCGLLSGGEKMKLALCCMMVSNQEPDMLILDEPTNNLDVRSLEVLTLAVSNFRGTLLVISHDEYFIDRLGITEKITVS